MPRRVKLRLILLMLDLVPVSQFLPKFHLVVVVAVVQAVVVPAVPADDLAFVAVTQKSPISFEIGLFLLFLYRVKTLFSVGRWKLNVGV